MGSQLHEVEVRLARAREILEHLKLMELESLTRSARNVTNKSVSFHSDDWDDRSEPIYISEYDEPLGDVEIGKLAAVTDDFVQNLRTALNYLVTTLAEIDSPKQRVSRSLQFPIESSERQFRDHRPDYLRGLSPKHVAMIERVQPYNGCRWTALIRDLSNQGKHTHRGLVKLIHQAGALPENEVEALAESARRQILDSRDDPDMWDDGVSLGESNTTRNVEVSGQIAFADRTPVIDKLHDLETQVSNFVEQFISGLP